MIEVKNLVKRYGDYEAVRGVSFTVEKGKIYGFLGPNGAGKSTTMNIITGCLAATEGEVIVNGYDIYEDAVEAKRCIGYLPEQPPLYMDMTVEEYLLFVGRAKSMKGDALYQACDRAIEKTGLTDVASRLIKNLSKGYKQRVGIAQAILGNPEIIILDEPTVGLDPLQIIEIRDLIKELGREHTVILSSHILTEISAVCDYILIIAHGKIVASDTIENLTRLYDGGVTIDLSVRGSADRVREVLARSDGQEDNPGDDLHGLQSLTIQSEEDGVCTFRLSCARGVDVRDAVFFRFADARIPILSMTSEEITLEKVFLELTGSAPELDGTDEAAAMMAQADRAEEDGIVDEEPMEEDKAESAPEAKDDTSSGGNDDYKPLFGGRD